MSRTDVDSDGAAADRSIASLSSGQIPAHWKAESMLFSVNAFTYALPITRRAASLSTGQPVSISYAYASSCRANLNGPNIVRLRGCNTCDKCGGKQMIRILLARAY